MMTNKAENVFSNASAYEVYVGRWSRVVARDFLNWLGVGSGLRWLDVGAGTGILTQVILDHCAPQKVVGIDLSEQYLAYARQTIADDRAEFTVGNATALAYETPEFDVAVAGLVLNFVPSPEDTVRGMKNAVKLGGMVAAYVWDYGGRMEMMRHFWDAAAAVDPSAKGFDAGTQFAICDPNNLRALFETLEFKSVEVSPIDIPAHFANFDDFWQPFLGAQGSVSKYLRGADDEKRDAIQKQLQQQLPFNPDKSIDLTARAWAVKGIR